MMKTQRRSTEEESPIKQVINDQLAYYMSGQVLRQCILAGIVLCIAHWLACLWVAIDINETSGSDTWFAVAEVELNVKSRCTS